MLLPWCSPILRTMSDSAASPVARTSLAAVCTELSGEGGMTLQQWPVAPLGPAMVRIAVRAASVNFPDVLIVRGLYQFRPEPPFVPGSECAGVITEIGAGVGGFCGRGPGADPARFRRVRLRGGGDAEGAAGASLAREHAVRRGRCVQPGLRHRLPRPDPARPPGGRRIGRSCSGRRAAAAPRRCRSPKQPERRSSASPAARPNATWSANSGPTWPSTTSSSRRCRPAVKEATGGRGVDVVFDAVGGPDVREPLRSLAWNGRYLTIGFASGDIPEVKLNQTILKGISIVGVGVRDVGGPRSGGKCAGFPATFRLVRAGAA